MKKIIPILALVISLGACKSKVNTAGNNMVLVDTTGLSTHNVLTDVGNNKYVVTEKPVAPVSHPATHKSPASTTGNNNNSNTTYSSGTNTTANASYPQEDKGWSHAAKGTAVGAGSGAIIGAAVNKDNRVGGAIVGSVIGAGAGYVIGRSVDKKTGRVARARARKHRN